MIERSMINYWLCKLLSKSRKVSNYLNNFANGFIRHLRFKNMETSFTGKIRQLEHICAVLLAERKEFQVRLKALTLQNESLTQTINQQSEKIQRLDKHSELPSASKIDYSDTKLNDQKEKINTLIQEIDQCLGLVGS